MLIEGTEISTILQRVLSHITEKEGDVIKKKQTKKQTGTNEIFIWFNHVNHEEHGVEVVTLKKKNMRLLINSAKQASSC